MEKWIRTRMTEDFLEEQQPYALWLAGIERLTNKEREKLLFAYGEPKEIYRAGRKGLSQILKKEKLEEVLRAQKADVRIGNEELERKDIHFIPLYHPSYPRHLYEVPDRPFGLYVKGRLPSDERRSVAIVGARECSEYGRMAAELFGGKLAKAGVQIISGMARGVDGIAQSAALKAGGDTYAVLGCGADICYPASNAALYERAQQEGGIISEYAPGTQPTPKRFPARNRIISGLADAVLVIEARKKSGTLITVDMALEQGRDVYVVPGRITDTLSDGCNRLLSQGASPALSPEQLIAELFGEAEDGMDACPEGQDTLEDCRREAAGYGALTAGQRELLSLLDYYPVTLDQIRLMMEGSPLLCGWSLQETMAELLQLTMEGFVKNEGGCYFLSGERRG